MVPAIVLAIVHAKRDIWGTMYIKRKKEWVYRDGDRTVKVPRYVYRLCEKLPGQKETTVLWLGELEGFEAKADRDELCRTLESLITTGQFQPDLFGGREWIHERAMALYSEWKAKEDSSVPASPKVPARQKDLVEKELMTIRKSSFRTLQSRSVGAEHICYSTLKDLGLADFLRERGWNDKKIKYAMIQVIARSVHPASELATANYVQQNSAVCELLGVDPAKVTKDVLYSSAKSLEKLYSDIEDFFHRRVVSLFDVDDSILVMDLTNVFMEGRMEGSGVFKYGRSKEKRYDCKIVGLAAVVTEKGLLVRTRLFAGNIQDVTTLQGVMASIGGQDPAPEGRRTVIIDSGFCSADNLKWLKENNYDYITVRRSHGDEELTPEGEPVAIRDRDDSYDITLQKVKAAGEQDTLVLVKSDGKRAKERGMDSRLVQNYEDGLKAIKAGIGKKGGTKKRDKVLQRLGRLKERSRGIHSCFRVEFTYDKDNTDRVTGMTWEADAEAMEERFGGHGQYVIQSSISDGAKPIWDLYNSIRIVEEAYKTLKLDLEIRPVYHKTDKGAEAHIALALMAYWVVSVTLYRLKESGITVRWKRIVEIANSQQRVTVAVERQDGKEYRTRTTTEPEALLSEIQRSLGISPKPVCFFVKQAAQNTETIKGPPPKLQRDG